jgi:hypothetical protein
MEVGSTHPNFKLSTMLNLKDVQPRQPNQNMLAYNDNILKIHLNGGKSIEW